VHGGVAYSGGEQDRGTDMKHIPSPSVEGVPEGFREVRFFNEDVELNYVVGPNNGHALLLIPGQMESWQGYKRVMPALAQRFQVFVVDLRGHGKSTRTPGSYSYNICGEDLTAFIREIVQRPAIVAGLSSGGVLAIWLAANAPEDVLAVVAEDPPIFSSVWPRIKKEKFMLRNFQMAVDILGRGGERDLQGYFSEMGFPPPGRAELLKIPRPLVAGMFALYRINRRLRPGRPYDAPFLPYNIRSGLKFLSEYDTDFSRATLDGCLSKDFDPEAALRSVRCPMLLLRASAVRHETWGLLGAIDDEDLERIVALVKDLKVVEMKGAHEIHMVKPERYIEELTAFVDELQARKLLT